MTGWQGLALLICQLFGFYMGGLHIHLPSNNWEILMILLHLNLIQFCEWKHESTNSSDVTYLHTK